MLAIEVTLLTGQYRATQFDDRTKPEWPMHPARLFFAAVEAVLGDSHNPVDDELDVLGAWEDLGAPAVTCSDRSPDGKTDAFRVRATVDHFVPGNSASSHRRDLQPNWIKIEELKSAVATAADAKALGKAVKALEKVVLSLRSSVVDSTRFSGKESDSVERKVLEVLPDNRGKQPRTFPVVTPDTPTVTFSWAADISAEHRVVLDGVLARISRIGHSSSQVSCRIVDELPMPTWVPAERGTNAEAQLRTVESGVLGALREAYDRHQGRMERTMHAEITPYRRVGAPRESEARGQAGAGAWIVLRFGRDRLPLHRTQDIARSVRAALIAHAAEPVAPVISGHDTGADRAHHLGVLALPNVTNRRSDGTVQAVAIALPPAINDQEYAAVEAALESWRNQDGSYDLRLPGGFECRLGEAFFNAAGSTSHNAEHGVGSRGFWGRTGEAWSSVTPVVLDRHPKLKASADFDAVTTAVVPIVADMCVRAGLPRPTRVVVSPSPVWPTVPIVGRTTYGRNAFPVYRVGGDGPRKFTTHLGLVFPEKVRGPIVLGAGRYFGYGLMYPTPQGVVS